MRKLLYLMIVAAAFCALQPSPASAQGTPSSFGVYAVKFVCGLQSPTNLTPPSEPPVKPGNYATKINVELLSPSVNSGASAATATVSLAGASSTASLTLSLVTRFSTQDITCADIAPAVASLFPNGAPPPFINGYVNIFPVKPALLAVTAVYTSRGYFFPGPGATFLPPVPNAQVDIDVVPETLINVASPTG